ncbi:hypothetical protein [Xanthomonas euvesicatoria]|uniref:hypothetical protein n=1 Tax=Xanthomonas euvesicatoria TaxID=456327 RepID=UPI00062D05F8|nr:hypothetical protein [Xanthomonas euvesicatoria]KLA68398.1 hypothetical protein XEUVF42_18730 [Xanthomonas euvesicatoria]KLA76874.1 hypothetical protein XEUVG41_19305 [Xanthomonas euvesicatoria]
MARTIAQAEALAEKLRALPAIENKNRPISKAEEIKLLADEIAALQERNYSLQQIAEFLTGEGLEISTATLKNYLQRSKATSKRPSKKKPAAAPKEAPSPTPQATAGQSIGERAAAALPPAKSDHHQTAQAAITRPDRERI